MRFTTIAFTLAAFGLSGCLEADQTASGFKSATASGTLSGVSTLASNVRSGRDFSAVTTNGYAYAAGAIKDEGFQAYAGLTPGVSVSAPPASGTATMTGTFEVASVTAISVNGDSLSGFSSIDTGTLSLSADFGAQTLTGTGSGLRTLQINGTFSGDTLSGRAIYNGLSGPLTGRVGSNEAIGVFHGDSDSAVHAGGFIVN